MDIKQGDVFFADMGKGYKSEFMGKRPVLVVSNDIINKVSPTVIVAMISDHFIEPKLPTHVKLQKCEGVLPKDSIILLEQVRTIDKNRLQLKTGSLTTRLMEDVTRSWNFTTMLGEEKFKLYSFTDQEFILGNIIDHEEDYEYEFKEILPEAEPRDVINEKLIPYVAAFLNDNGGRLLFGIRDYDRTVTGIRLTSQQKDDIRQLINSKMDAIYPRVSPSAYSFTFHEVYDENRALLDNQYVLEIVINPPVNPTIVYFVDRSKIYSKVNGGKKPLEWSAIQDFILRKSLRRK